jgi:hypothetical protein
MSSDTRPNSVTHCPENRSKLLRNVPRYLRIQVAGSACLNLMEVRLYTSDGSQVAGTTASMDCVEGTGYCNAAANCVDNNESTMCHNDCGSNGWLEIDIGAIQHFLPFSNL